MRPTIARAELYSYLVTRHTGRAVRTNIERQIAEAGRAVLAVLDLRHVALIDFSCADEVVAKLVVLATAGAAPHPRFVLFRGVSDHHLEPIQSALARQGLAAAAESADGEPFLMGTLEPRAAATWREISVLGHTGRPALAERLNLSLDVLSSVLDELEARALVIRDGEVYVSLGCALRDADPTEPQEPEAT